MVCLVTGAAGFIGFYISKALLERGEKVVGIDNLNDYYAPVLKYSRLKQLQQFKNFEFHQVDITDQHAMASVFDRYECDIRYIIHLAAQAGVRYSLQNPFSYVQTNINGHLNILELARQLPNLQRIFYASSSSVYGLNTKLPFSENDRVDLPSSVYAASKRSAELLSFTYYHLYGIKQTGLRFFTVYGPWGRPDMAYYIFANSIINGRTITLYRGADLSRDFTYIDDVVDAMLSLWDCSDLEDYNLLNIGNSRRERVEYLIKYLEVNLGKTANVQYIKRPETDIEATLSDISEIYKITGWSPKTLLKDGTCRFINWFKSFYHLS
ncbi:SDR family NAD(P)-dependent oxidoreductase [Commensalibacter oyaizuii]|uniref:SDR family NAD(P)-dependent oxidoreductase n=1 Tax=Commensalibacter oyaizuii TaxID=3043873 RepID=A0ABT6Q172_9PROT|nr:SDR family NAD(P)-dependent oxidoreductase [Commensalibacter sp. TBRC 16381]MDI2090848.1 SDR family NAD(P)-dependent oxidoreductase [Commensalibacter sp. TBRC 16381]